MNSIKVALNIISLLILMMTVACKSDSGHQVKDQNNIQGDSSNTELPIIGLQDQFAKEYQGLIDGQYPIRMFLFNNGEGVVSGWYVYTKYNRRIFLEGTIDLDESVTLNETTENGNATFKGNWTDLQKIYGIWTNKEKNKQLDFEVKEVELSEKQLEWTGAWYLNDPWDGGQLLIANVTDDSLEFNLSIYRSGHIGEIAEKALIKGNKAVFKAILFDSEKEPCNLVFILKGDSIIVEQNSSPWACGFGMRAYAGGTYDNRSIEIKPEISFGAEDDFFKSQVELDNFKALVGAHAYKQFAFNMQFSDLKKEAEGDTLQIVEGQVYGTGNSYRCIIARNLDGDYYAATADHTDYENPRIRYFSTKQNPDSLVILPIQTWLENGGNYPLSFN